MKKFFLTLIICAIPLQTFCEEQIKRNKEDESQKGIAGTINATADIIVGAACLIGAGLIAPQAQQSIQAAYKESNGLSWWVKKETWMGFFDNKLDNDEKRIGGAYFQALGWLSATIALGGFGVKKICRGIGLIK